MAATACRRNFTATRRDSPGTLRLVPEHRNQTARPREGTGVTPTRPAPSSSRLHSLDGLRGIAALVVVLHHSMLVAPALANGTAAGWAWWVVHGPPHLLWVGTEAVYVFFILSGFVLTLPFLRSNNQPSFRKYYVSRVLRLYLPVLAAVGFALALFALVGRRGQHPGSSWWMLAHDIPVSIETLSRDALLLFGTDFLNSPLWSLRWEVIFSLLLPIYLFAGRRLTGLAGIIAGALLLACIPLGAFLDFQALIFLPIFGLGVLMAGNLAAIQSWSSQRSEMQWRMLKLLGLALVGWNWWPGIGLINWSAAPPTLGAAVLVLVALGWPAAENTARRPVLYWLGSRSFSLYLTHEPVVVSCAIVLATTDAALNTVVACPLSLIIAELFYRTVERPAHIFSRWAGRQVLPQRSSDVV